MRHHVTALFLLGAIVLGRPLHGQANPDSIKLRNDCRLASQTLLSGRPGPHEQWALHLIQSCGDLTAEVVAQVWGTPPRDTTSLAWLVAASVAVRDRRVLDATMVTARGLVNSQLVRLSALRVLASYADPIVSVSLEDLVATGYRTLPGRSDGSTRNGPQPLGPGTADSVIALLDQLCTSDADTTVRRASTYLKRGLMARR